MTKDPKHTSLCVIYTNLDRTIEEITEIKIHGTELDFSRKPLEDILKKLKIELN